ncbi:MAG TPA: hypothetical protein VF699_03570 [Caulobacteraceae bacterium]|jgi:hypothetical protein
MLRALIIAALLAAVPAAALAGGGKKKEEGDALGPHVDLAAVGVPIIVDGRIVNYVFVQARLNVAPGQDAVKLRTKEPWYRDALVRAAHRTPFVKADDWNHVDDRRLNAVLLAEGRRISGPKAFSSAQILNQAPRNHRAPIRRKTAAR